MKRTTIIKVDTFAPQARAMRKHFESRFSNPHGTARNRFVWDWWHVASQYTLLRTPAWEFFPGELYRDFHDHLVWWGRRTLGCHDVSPPWLSLYVDGCRQEFHADRPHGPFAFVFSLTPWVGRTFRGGETLLMRESTLSYWSRRPTKKGTEHAELFETVAPRFNRLTIFDPRIPHAVGRVEGPLDPKDGRLVVHGWFVQPRPFIEGPLQPSLVQEKLEALTEGLHAELQDAPALDGLVSIRFGVNSSGACTPPRMLAHTLRADDARSVYPSRLIKSLMTRIEGWRFARQRAPSTVTLPFVFER